ncbi:hypothetical protein MBLNU230_g8401t1 [Neophaeotheca triangularis]
MALSDASPGDMHIRNVSWHHQGKVEHGTLALERDHMVFAFRPAAKAPNIKNESTEKRNSIGGSTSSLSAPNSGNPQPTPTSDAGQQTSVPEKATALQPKPRHKRIWIPYPLINHCQLRPSHAVSGANRAVPRRPDLDATAGTEDLFPPTYGTSEYVRPSLDSARLTAHASPRRPASPSEGFSANLPAATVHGSGSGRQPAIRLRCKDFTTMAFHFHGSLNEEGPDDVARRVFYTLRSRCCANKVEDLFAFHFTAPVEEEKASMPSYDARREFARMGISPKASEGPASAWRISEINRDYSYASTYPSILCVPRLVSDNLLKYSGTFRSKARIPALAYLHSNGGSVTRSSQPMVGVGGKRNPQDERLVSAIFSSHTPPEHSRETSPSRNQSSNTLDTDGSILATTDGESFATDFSSSAEGVDIEAATAIRQKRVYGSTRRNLIVDARPRINALANRAGGGGIEDVSNYTNPGDTPVERVFLDIANIHAMRASLDKVVESLAGSDYVNLPPNQEALRRSGWLAHIQGLLEGSTMVAKKIGLGGSHVLVHCSDGWDRTSQVSALAQIMLDPYYRTFEGFITLIQKDFLSFGHKFRDRQGVQGSDKWFEIENERVLPPRTRESSSSEGNSINALGSKAISGAKTWFEKNRTSIFRQQASVMESEGEKTGSRPSTPPPNPLIHSPPVATKEEKKTKAADNEIAPIFHQFLDAVWQMHYQYPESFEFNERFLRRLFFHSYAGQYGEFLFNNEKERVEHAGQTASVWSHFMARKREFLNPGFTPPTNDLLLFPRRTHIADSRGEYKVSVRWWNDLFGRKSEEMNLPETIHHAVIEHTDSQNLSGALSETVSFDDRPHNAVLVDTPRSNDPKATALKETKSTPSLGSMTSNFTSTLSRLSMSSSIHAAQSDDAAGQDALARSSLQVQKEEPEFDVVTRSKSVAVVESGIPEAPATVIEESETDTNTTPTTQPQPDQKHNDELHMAPSQLPQQGFQQDQAPASSDGDPLGVSHVVPTSSSRAKSRSMDFSAFASQNTFSER